MRTLRCNEHTIVQSKKISDVDSTSENREITSPNEICSTIAKLDNKKSPRQDQIRNIVLKSLPINDITHLTQIINKCLTSAHFSKPWKHTILTTLPKQNKNTKKFFSKELKSTLWTIELSQTSSTDSEKKPQLAINSLELLIK
ncbi:hypothetical protein TNCV_2282691 [Trichonephila clavipes]|nr:hypothetical protein TNCV_2282691 [Trichonephila clavipes]